MACYRSYIICSSPRSGSTLLCKLLAATDKTGKPDSHFHRQSIHDWVSDYKISKNKFTTDRELLAAIFHAARERGEGGTGMFGLRLQRQSFDYFTEKLHILCPGLSCDADRIHKAFGHTLFIHLTRHNKLQQAISLVKATQTGLWHRAPDGTELERQSAPQEPVYDASAIATQLSEFTDMDQQWNSWFAKESLAPFRLSYEQLSENPTDILADVVERLGLDREICNEISLPVSKLADATNKSWEKRFQNEAQHLL